VSQPATLVSVHLNTDCCNTNGGSLGYILRSVMLQIVAGKGLGHVRRRKSGVEERDVFSLSVVAEQVISAAAHRRRPPVGIGIAVGSMVHFGHYFPVFERRAQEAAGSFGFFFFV